MFKKILITVVSCLLVLGVIFTVVSMTDSKTVAEKLAQYKKEIQPQTLPLVSGTVDLGGSSLADELPDISIYPLTVDGKAPLNIEIFTSTEKGGKGSDGWLNDIAARFNQSGITVNGQRSSVSVRSISSGLIGDYIVSGKYLPDAITPSNPIWPETILAQGGNITLERSRLVGNVAGVCIKKNLTSNLLQKYGEINSKTIAEATINGDLVTGYTNPFVSSAGMNFLYSVLYSFDSNDVLSDKAVKGFEDFQAHVPAVAFSTLQMTTAAKNGSLDAFVFEYQQYKNSPDIRRDYEFFPYGLRHDNPIYSVGTLSADKQQLLDTFIEFCMSTESQSLATQYGFNDMENYVSDVPLQSGGVLLSAQSIWKEKKDVGREIIAVFVADVSGSMDGTPISMLKQSLKNGGNYIKSDTKIGIVSFDSKVYINMPISEFSLANRSFFNGAIGSLTAGSNTATYDAVLVALSMLNEELEKNPNAKGMIFLLTDGDQNEGRSFETLEAVLKETKIPVHTIGYNLTDKTKEVLRRLSSINEASAEVATSDNIQYVLRNFFNAEM